MLLFENSNFNCSIMLQQMAYIYNGWFYLKIKKTFTKFYLEIKNRLF